MDRRQAIGSLCVPSVIHALESVGETTTMTWWSFNYSTMYITLEMFA